MVSGNPIDDQARELNRILGVGARGRARVRSHLDTGERVQGNPVWIFELQITPAGGAPYLVEHREIVSAAAVASYPEGTSIACRIDPEDPRRIAFGDRPFM
jgi:hypothetical protein